MSLLFRFLNPDLPEYAQQQKDDYAGTNLFAYCVNNPINNEDYEGFKYSPSKATDYAENWWCDYNTRYGRNPNGDCANFVSQCLYEGGLSKMTGAFKWGWHCYMNRNINVNGQRAITYDRSHAWAAAQNLYDWLKDNNHISRQIIVRSKKNVDKVGKLLYKKSYCTAVIFFQNNRKKNINHSAISGQVIKGKNKYDVYYYAHSKKRNGKRFYGKVRKYYSLKDYLRNYKNGTIYVGFIK